MKMAKTISAGAAALLSVASASAIQSYMVGHEGDVFLSEGQSYTGTWDVTAAPFGYQNVIGATASFRFVSATQGAGVVDIDLGNSQLPLGYYPFWGTYSASYNLGSLSVALIADIQADGLLNYTITALNIRGIQNDFTIDYARLTVTAPDSIPGNRVADGGATIALLGVGLIGLAQLRRKIS